MFSQNADSLSFPLKQVIVFEPYPDPKQKISNDLLQHIAEGSNRLRTSVSFMFEGRVVLNWTWTKDDKLNAVFSIKDLKVSGDTRFRDFSLEQVLLPDLVEFELLISFEGNKTIIKKSVVDLEFREGAVFYSQEVRDVGAPAQPTVALDHIRLGYSERTYRRLDAWLGFLGEYYEAGLLLAEIEKELSKLDFSDPGNLILSEFPLCESEKNLSSIAGRAFFKALSGGNDDPEGVFEAFSSLTRRADLARSEFNHLMTVVDSLLWSEGRVLSASGQRAAARDYFEHALVLNPFYVPSQLAIAELDFSEGQKERSVERLGAVYSIMNPHGSWRRASDVLTDSIMARYFKEAFNFNREGRFKESLDLLAPLERFCERVTGIYNCPAELDFRLNQTHLGMYRSFLVVGSRALRNGNLGMCRTYVNSALRYQEENAGFVPDAAEALDVLQQCVNRYIEMAGEQFSRGEYPMASQSLEEARELCAGNPALFCPSDLQKRQQFTRQSMASGKPPDPRGVDFTGSQVINLKKESSVIPGDEILEQIVQAQFLAWAGKVDDASVFEDRIIQALRQLDLEHAPEIVTAMEKLKLMIRNKECELVARDVESLFKKGLRYLEYSEFSLAYEAGAQILERMKSHPHCELSLGDSLSLLTGLEMAVQYLELYDQAKSLYQSAAPGGYAEFLKRYHEAEALFHSRDLGQKGLIHRDLLTFISSSGNTALVMEGILYMANNPEEYAQETISLLWVLKSQGVSANEARNVQEQSGIKLARYFGGRGDQARYEALIRSFTRKDHWFRHFEQAFIRNWPVR